MTKQRALILKTVRDSTNHPTAEEIFLLAKRLLPSIVRATVYNNLNALCDAGLIRRIKVHEQPDHYDRATTMHDHLICDRCGKLTDIFLGDLLTEFRKKSDIDIGAYELNLHYICRDCAAKMNPCQNTAERGGIYEGDKIMSDVKFPEAKFYRCAHCGNIIAFINNTGVPVVCCGEKMQELVPNSTDAAQEKHVPVIVREGNTVTVTVGSAAHPMTDKHYIQWICLQTAEGRQRKTLTPDMEPKAVFALTDGDEVVAAYAYCNLHGLWKSALQ